MSQADSADDDGASGASNQRRILRGAGVVSLLTLGSRVLGLVRDVLVAQLLGATARDAFLFAWTLPNLFRRLFGEGALSAAFLPVYTRLLDSGDRAGARRLAVSSASALLVALGVCAGVLELLVWLPLPWASLFPNDPPEKVELILELVRILAPYALLICLVAFLAGMHHARRSFAVPSAMPIVLNLVWVGALVVASLVVGEGSFGVLEQDGARALAWAILGAGLLQVILVYVPERRELPLRPAAVDWRDPHLREVLRGFLPMTVGLGIYQLNLLLDRFIAEALIPGDGAITALYLGDRMMQLPQALVGIAVATAAFPELSRLAGRGELDELGRTLIGAVRMCLTFAVPAAVGLALVADPLVAVFFAGPAFDADLAARTSAVISIVAAAVVATSILHLLVRAYYALGDTRTPVRVGAVAVAVNLALNLALVASLRERGLALATVTSTAVNVLLLAWGLRHRLPQLAWRPLLLELPRIVLAGFGMGVAVWLCGRFAVSADEGSSAPGRGFEAARLAIMVLVGVGSYVGCAALIGVADLRGWVARRRERRSRR